MIFTLIHFADSVYHIYYLQSNKVPMLGSALAVCTSPHGVSRLPRMDIFYIPVHGNIFVSPVKNSGSCTG